MTMIEWKKSSRSLGTGNCIEAATWRKSSRSPHTVACVETARLDKSVVGIRDSKQGTTGSVLEFSPHEFRRFINGVKNS